MSITTILKNAYDVNIQTKKLAFKINIILIQNPVYLIFFFFFFFFKIFLADIYTCPILGPLVPLFWISGDVSSGFQSQSGLPYSHCGGECDVRSLRSTSGATRCRPLDGKHCGAPTGFISCPRILLCGISESRTRDQQIITVYLIFSTSEFTQIMQLL